MKIFSIWKKFNWLKVECLPYSSLDTILDGCYKIVELNVTVAYVLIDQEHF